MEKALHREDVYKIKQNNNYLNYYILSAYYTKDKKESLKLFTKIKDSISLELLPSFVFILSAIGEEYKFDILLTSFTAIQKELSTDAIKKLANYPKYFIYLLYPQKVDLDIGVISNYKLEKIQQDIQKKALFLYQAMYDKYRYRQGINQLDYALLSVEYIYPYLLEQYKVNYDDFTNIFNMLIKKGYFITLLTNDKCSNDSKINFAIFGRNNILNVSNFFRDEQRVANKLFQELKDDKAIFPFFYVVDFYNHANQKEWELFQELLNSLPYEYRKRIAFLKRLEINGYFRNTIEQDDYKDKVFAENGTTYPKYKYILTTPYPSQDDPSLFKQILYTNISDTKLKDSLLELIRKDTDELATHTFTTFDKFTRGTEILNNIDDTLFVVAIISAPFTGGVSLSYVAISATKKAVKMGAKNGFKAMTKKVALKSRKIVNKGIRKVRQGRKILNGGIAGVKNIKKVGTAINKIENIVGKTSNAIKLSVGGTALYLYLNSSELSVKEICEEK